MATMTQAQTDQFRFYGYEHSKNVPSNQSAIAWVKGLNESQDIISLIDGGGSIIKLGIQTLPGVKFYLNDKTAGIIIDHTGIYELDLRDTTTSINTFFFDAESLALVDSIDSASIIVDIMYKQGTVE